MTTVQKTEDEKKDKPCDEMYVRMLTSSLNRLGCFWLTTN